MSGGFAAQGVGEGAAGSRISRERPAALETAPEGWRPRSAARGRRGRQGQRPPLEGPGPDPHSWAARLRPHCSLEAISSPLLPHPPRSPCIAPGRQPLVTPTPTRPRRRPLQAAVADTGRATGSDGSGDGGSGAARSPGGRRQLGRAACVPGAAGAGPAVGSAKAPHEQSGAGARGARGGSRGHSPGRGRAGLAPSGDRAGPALRAEGALATGSPAARGAGDGAAGRAWLCGREAQGPARRGGQRR